MKAILKLITITLIIVFLGGVGYLIIYPYYDDIVIFKNQVNAERISHNSTLQLFTQISPVTYQAYQDDLTDQDAVEYIDQEKLAQYMNEGKVTLELEKYETKMEIGSANIDAYIRDGETAETMIEGPWRFPLSSGPGEKGNMVIIGHRYQELPPSTNTFFNMHKIKVGDKIKISQTGDVSYTYTVVSNKMVESNDRSVLQKYGDHRITLITCGPLWTAEQRRVVVGILDRVYQEI
jgi:LPXTG-site transpeptidase (sortase) family protein